MEGGYNIVKAFGSVACLALFFAGITGYGTDSEATEGNSFEGFTDSSSHDPCRDVSESQTTAQRFLMLVSTMDGYVTAINGRTGNVQWTLGTGSGPLLSSSIGKLELTRNGAPTRLIPSLDGGLYHMDSNGIEAVPLSADAMLSSSFHFADDSMIIGRKEIESYGINVNSGKVRYICSSSGCKFFEDDKMSSEKSDEVFVIRRNDKTVRAVEMQTGLEKWNFSVGLHDISYVVQPAQVNQEKSGREEHIITDDEWQQCNIESEDMEDSYYFETSSSYPVIDPSDVRIKVLVSSGIVVAISHSHPGVIYWKHKFETAIASSWLLQNGKLSEVDLFNKLIVPALGQSDAVFENDLETGDNMALLYVGTFNEQLYIQPSIRFIEEVELATEEALKKGSIADINMPRVAWRPYLATAGSRTPIVADTQPRLEIKTEEEKNWTLEEKDGKSLVQWHDNYPFDGGYYLFPSYTPIRLLGESCQKKETREGGLLGFLPYGLSGLLITVLCGIIYKFRKHLMRSEHKKTGSHLETIDDSVPMKTVSESSVKSVNQSTENVERSNDYISRFAMDFELKACLGRGGFGVVFQAVNRLDDCDYAVKRIALFDSSRAREKVMREVKALARLDHPGIVRYYQSWLESPPLGWQEERDRASLDISATTQSQDCVPTGSSMLSQKTEKYITQEIGKSFNINPLKPFDPFNDDFTDVFNITSKNSESIRNQRGKSNSRCLPGLDDTWSHSTNKEDSFEISFRNNEETEEFRKENQDDCSVNDCDTTTTNSKLEENFDDFEVIFDNKSVHRPECRKSDSSLSKSSGDSSLSKSSGDPVIAASIPQKQKSLETRSSKDSCFSSSDVNRKRSTAQKLYLYIQMQLCQPESLKEWLSNNIMNRDKNQLLDIFHQIVRAISYVHQQGLMHRDLKPSNIFFALDGTVKIGDFGLVTAAEEKCIDDGYVSQHSMTMKHTNQVGTTLYMSPEQSSGGTYTYKVDIYALGMIFFELFCPFHTQMERLATLNRVRQLVFPTEFIQTFSSEYEFVKPLLSHDPKLRPSTTDILHNVMFANFEDAAEVLNRLYSQSRQRTTSQSSSNSLNSPSICSIKSES